MIDPTITIIIPAALPKPAPGATLTWNYHPQHPPITIGHLTHHQRHHHTDATTITTKLDTKNHGHTTTLINLIHQHHRGDPITLGLSTTMRREFTTVTYHHHTIRYWTELTTTLTINTHDLTTTTWPITNLTIDITQPQPLTTT